LLNAYRRRRHRRRDPAFEDWDSEFRAKDTSCQFEPAAQRAAAVLMVMVCGEKVLLAHRPFPLMRGHGFREQEGLNRARRGKMDGSVGASEGQGPNREAAHASRWRWRRIRST
jgi:hypothetical protein